MNQIGAPLSEINYGMKKFNPKTTSNERKIDITKEYEVDLRSVLQDFTKGDNNAPEKFSEEKVIANVYKFLLDRSKDSCWKRIDKVLKSYGLELYLKEKEEIKKRIIEIVNILCFRVNKYIKFQHEMKNKNMTNMDQEISIKKEAFSNDENKLYQVLDEFMIFIELLEDLKHRFNKIYNDDIYRKINFTIDEENKKRKNI